MMFEAERPLSIAGAIRGIFSEARALRKEFPKTPAGKKAFKIIADRNKCEWTTCEMPGRSTIDFEVAQTLEQLPTCEPHRPALEEIIKRDLETQGLRSRVTRNGWGRP